MVQTSKAVSTQTEHGSVSLTSSQPPTPSEKQSPRQPTPREPSVGTTSFADGHATGIGAGAHTDDPDNDGSDSDSVIVGVCVAAGLMLVVLAVILVILIHQYSKQQGSFAVPAQLPVQAPVQQQVMV